MSIEYWIIIILLIVIAIQFGVILLGRKFYIKKYKYMLGRSAEYLDWLDRENYRLKIGEVPKKARKNYMKLIKE